MRKIKIRPRSGGAREIQVSDESPFGITPGVVLEAGDDRIYRYFVPFYREIASSPQVNWWGLAYHDSDFLEDLGGKTYIAPPAPDDLAMLTMRLMYYYEESLVRYLGNGTMWPLDGVDEVAF